MSADKLRVFETTTGEQVVLNTDKIISVSKISSEEVLAHLDGGYTIAIKGTLSLFSWDAVEVEEVR